MDTHQQPTTKCQPVIPPEYRYFLTLIAHIPVPVPRSKILCGWGIMGARNNFLSSSITYFAWDISIRSSSSSSIGSPYSTHRCQNSAPVLDLWISPSFPYAAYVLPCSSSKGMELALFHQGIPIEIGGLISRNISASF